MSTERHGSEAAFPIAYSGILAACFPRSPFSGLTTLAIDSKGSAEQDLSGGDFSALGVQVTKQGYQGGQLTCSFCGKSQREVRKLIAGPTVYICDECIRLCTDIIAEEVDKEPKPDAPKKLPNPHEIRAFLDTYVIGQERAKKILSVAVYNHYKRIDRAEKLADEAADKDAGKGSSPQAPAEESGESTAPRLDDGVELQKSNVLLVGPTGTGKTLLAQTLARLLDVPFTMADATTLTEAGYVGEDVENMLSSLLVAAGNDPKKAEKGIIYIDEIDKVARRGDSPSMTRDVSGEGVQQALLKIVEGTKANVAPRGTKKYGQAETVTIDTSNILVICGGSFTGIDEYIQRRIGKKGIGFGAEIKATEKNQRIGALLAQVLPQDLTKYGLIPELIGRLPVIAPLEDLDEPALKRILTEPKNALIKQYQKLFSLERVELEFSEEAIDQVVSTVVKNKTGARGLRAILETAMLDIMYEVPFLPNIEKCIITAAVIAGDGEPELVFNERKSA